ncbi:cardiomyopathy-associated protein 5 [Elgaria multicarinata webbii]|uniref:cardiomyopathy-associated protein 5 n=1 Tax=Elgaria multicarinata webbii TaxID=159646 RepID=UPI002FCCED1C
METDCNSEYDGSPDVSVEDEEDEDEEGPQEQQLTRSSLKKLNQNEEVKSKLSDAMDAVQSEDSGLTWETSSSRCSTSQASETSTTSGVYSMENSFMDCPPGKVMFPMDEEKTAQKRPSSSPDQRPLSPNEKISTDSTKCDFSRKPMQVKAQERELDPSDPHSWPFQVQPSKIKDYLVQITQDVADSLPEEKENALMKKGELPLKGTVRARIQLITAVLEERHKKIFRRVNGKDLPPPPDVIKKPREQPKIFSRQGISVSLRHIERDATDKNNKKEILRYNLKHVETNISKSGASVPYNKDEKRMRRSFLPETLNKASEKLPPISSLLADKAKKPDTKSYSLGMQTSVPEQVSFAPDRPDKTEKRESQALLAGTAKVMPEESANLLAEMERQEMQDYSPVTTEDTDRSEKPKALLERETVQPCSPVSAEPLSYPVSKPENQSDSMVTVLSETTAQDVQYPNNAVAMQHASEQSVSAETRNQDIEFTAPSQLEIKDAALLHSAEETGKQAVPLYSPETAEPLSKQAELPPSVSSAEEQEKEQSEVGRSKEVVQEQLAMCLQAESGHLHVLHSMKEPEPGETVTDLGSTTSRIETQEPQIGSYTTTEKHSELLQPSYFTDEAEQKEKEHLESEFTKQAATAQDSVTAFLEPKHPDESHLRGQGEIQTAQPETQHPDSSLPIADAHRQETHSDSTAVAQPESEHPVISEPIKAPQGSEHLEPSHLKAEEVKQDSPFEMHSELPQPPYFTGEAKKKEKKRMESEFTKQAAPAQDSVTTFLEPKHPDVSHSRGQGENQTAQPETPCPDLSLPVADAHMEETRSDSRVIAQPESEHPVISEPIKASQGSEPLGPSYLKTKVKQDSSVEEHSELPLTSYFTGEAQQKGKEHLKSEFTKQTAQAQVSVSTSLEPKHPDVSYSHGQGEIQTAQPETQCPDLSLLVADVHREETHSDSTAITHPESEHPVISEPIKAPQGSESLGPSHLKGKEENKYSPAEALNLSEQLPPISSLLTENTEKQETQLTSLVTAAPLSKQPHSVLPCPTEQMAKQENLPQLPEIATVAAEASFTTAAFQNEEVTEVEFQPLLPTEVSSEELLPISREPDVAMERKTTHLVSPLPGEPPSEASVLSQEKVRLENQLYPSMNARLCSESQDESHPTINEGQQEGWFELDRLVEFQSRKQTMKQNSSVSFQLEETIALHSVDEGERNDRHPDKPITKPGHPDPLHPDCVLEKQERTQTDIEKTTQQLSHTVLPMEADTLQSAEEAEINGIPPHLPATAQNLSNSVYLLGTQEKQCVLTETATLDSVPSITAEAEKYNTTEPESKHMGKQSIQAVPAELEPDYPNVSHSISESGKPLDVSFPFPSAEERDLQSHRSVTSESDGEGPISSERKREEAGLHSLITPMSEWECPTAAPETQRSQKGLFDSSLNEVSKPSLIMVSLVPDEIKHQAVAAETTVSSVLASEQANFLSPERKDKAEQEGSQFPFPTETPRMVPEDSPSFTTFPVGEAREEPLYSPMAPKIGTEESNSIPEDFVSVEVKEMVPPVSELLSPETISSYVAAVGEKQDQSKHMRKQTIQAETAELEPDFPNVTHSGSEAGKLLDASSPVPSTEEGDLQSHRSVTSESDGEGPISSERKREEAGLHSLITPMSEWECPTAAPETQRSQKGLFDSSLNEASEPSPVVVTFVPDEIKHQAVAAETTVSSVLASEQANFLSPELKDKAEQEGSQFPFPTETPRMVPEDSPSFTTFPVGEAREEPLYSPMAPKIGTEESNSIPEDFVSVEVKEMVPPVSELLSPETISSYAAAVGEKQDQSKHMRKQTIQAETAELEPDFPNVTHSGSEAGKLLDASSPVPSTEEGDLQSHLPVTPEWEGEHPVSSEREKDESGLYPFITPTSKVECPTAAPETQGSQNDSFESPLNEVSKPSLIMVSFVPDEIKHQAVAAETTVSSVLASEQANFLSPELKDKAEIEGSQFPFPAAIPKMVPEESPSFTTFPVGEAREELLYSPMAPKIGTEESNSIPEDIVSEEVKGIHPPLSLYATVGEKQEQFHSFFNEESLAAEKEDMQDAQFNFLVTAQSEMRNQDFQPYCPTTTQPELEDLTLLNSTEEVRKQETPLCPPSALPSAPRHQELLGHKGEQGTQERIMLESEHSKEHDATLKPSIMQQELEQVKLLRLVKESAIEGNQPYSSITVQDSPQAADETERQQHQGSVSQTAEVGSGVSMLSELMDEAKKQELPPPLSEVAPLECKDSVLSTVEWGEVQHPLDLGHLGLSHSTETQLSSSEAQNQTSKQPPSVSSLLTKEVEEQEVKSHPAAASMSSSVLSQSSSALLDLMEEDEKQKNQPCSPEVANVMPEEPLSIAAFLLSEAKTIHASFRQTSETETLDAKSSFKEAGLLIERSGSASALPPETNVTMKREDQPSTTHFESEQFASKPQADVISRCSLEGIKENIPDIPPLPNVILNEPSNALILEPMNYTHTLNLHSSLSLEDSDTTVNKAMVERALKEPEIYLQKEKDLKDDEKWSEESIPAPELDQGNDTFAISEGCEEANIHVPPLISSADKEDKHVLESLECLEKVPVLKAKPFDEAEGVVVDHEPSVCKLNGKTLEGLRADNRETKGNESKELVKEKDAQENVETTMEVSFVPENMGDGILNATRIDYIEKYTLIDDASFTQTGKEQLLKDVQRPFDVTNENSEEGTSPVASAENTLELSLLERDFNKAKKENTHEDTSKILNEDETVRGNYENTEGEPNLVGADTPLFNSEKDELSQSPLFPLPVTAVNPELLEVPPTLAFFYKDLYKEIVEGTKEDSSKCPSSEETDKPFHTRRHASDDGSGIYFEKDIPNDYTPNNLEESQKEKVLKDQPINEQALNQTRVSEITWEPSEKVHEPIHTLAEANAHRGLLSPSGVVEGLSDTLIERPTEIVSDIKVGICQPTHAIPFGSGLYSSGASNDDSSQRREEESLSEETDQVLPEETSDEESSPILDYAATVYQNEALVQDESQNVACLEVDQNQQSEITEVHEVDNYVVRKPVEESTRSLEALQHVDSHQQSDGQPEGKLMSVLDEPMAQDAHPLDQEHLPYLDTERQTSEKSIGENIAQELTEHNIETIDQLEPEAINDKPFVELDYSLLSHDFDTYPLYSIKEEEYSDTDEDLAELMDYEMVGRDDVFREETSSEAAHEELLFDDRKSSDHISDSYEFVNEREASMYAEEEEFELMDSGKPPRNAPETEILQKEIEQADLDTYCYQCKCPISGEDKLFGEHKEHDVTDLDTAVALLKGQLNGFLDVLQERALKIEGFVSEIEALFNSLEENCKEKEQLLEEQNESIVKMVIGHHDRKAQSFEETKNTKMEYLYEQMVNFQEYIDTAKDTLEAIIKGTEGMDDFVFLKSSEEINKRLLSSVENILTLEKMPAAFSQFEHYAGGSANGEQTLKHMPVPHTPKLHPQDPSSATSTSIAVYWTVNEDDVIDFFQVYCMEEYPGSKEQSGLVEEYRVTVKESNCILEDLEPGHSYSVWVMAVNHTGCSFPSDKSTFRTAPPTPVIKAEECTVCSDTATIRWSTGHPEATDSFTLEYCRQYSPEGEGLRSLAGIKRPEMKVRLESNVNYFFYVRAVNTFGMSEQSEAALISTKGTRFHIMKGTAHPALQVSPNGTMICLAEGSKFAGTSPILGELLSTRGQHYWETTVTGCAAYKVGICYSPVRPDSVLGQNDTSWCLHCPSKTSFLYKVLHNGEMSDVIVTEQPPRIGILLDYNTGRLLFFNAERGQVLSAIRHKFTEAAHPAFVLEHPGVLNLHTGMELPEFVEQS